MWISGDVFLVPNSDGRFTPGQVIAHEKRTLNSASCAFFDQRVVTLDEGRALKLELARCFSSLLVTPDALNRSEWPVVGNQPVLLPKTLWPFEELLSKKQMGARVHGSGIVEDFLNAFYGLQAWDDWHKPDFLDGMLLSPEMKPKNLIITKS